MDIQSIGHPAAWLGFLGFVLVMLALDLGVFHRKAHEVSWREAASWSAVWVTMALLFNAGVWWLYGQQAGLEFLTGYLIEKALSVDNVFVFVVIFSALGIPSIYQHRVLFWGILSALLLRAAMIFAGAAMLAKFHWLIYVFGGFLVFTGVKLYLHRHETEHPERGRLMTLARRLIPSTGRFDGARFFTVENGKRLATPLFMALLLVELTDVVFAVDSIPAIFAVTQDPFIVFTSNIFAILGLRSLFFLLAGAVTKFAYLKVGLAAVLAFVGLKMTLIDVWKVPVLVSLAVVAGILATSITLSLVQAARVDGRRPAPHA